MWWKRISKLGKHFSTFFSSVYESIEHTFLPLARAWWREKENEKITYFLFPIYSSNLINNFPPSMPIKIFNRSWTADRSTRRAAESRMICELGGAQGAIGSRLFELKRWIAFVIALSLSGAHGSGRRDHLMPRWNPFSRLNRTRIVYLFNLRSDQYCLRRAHTIDSSALRILRLTLAIPSPEITILAVFPRFVRIQFNSSSFIDAVTPFRIW